MVKITETEENKGRRPHGSTQQTGTSSSQPFQLSGTNQEFGSRSVDVFGGLETLEAKHEAYERVRSRTRNDDEQQSLLKPDPVRDEELLGTSSSRHRQAPKRDIRDRDGFMRPQPQPRPRHNFHGKRPRMTPDHQKHPERWTRYDLSDVSNQDVSNRSNTSAALSFLSTLKKPSAAPSTSTFVDETMADSSTAMVTDEDWEVKPGPSSTTLSNSSESSNKAGSLDLEEPFKMRHSFRKPKTAVVKDTDAAAETDSDKPKFVSGKYVMPEYEIGKVAEQKSSKKITGTKSAKQTEKWSETSKDVKIVPVDDVVEDVVEAAAEAEPAVAMETTSEITFKSRKKVNKRGIRQKHLEEDEEEET